MATFEIIEKQSLKMIKATLDNEVIRAESGAMHYMRGEIEIESKMPGAGGFLKSMVSGENIFRPTYTGSGEVYFGPPIFGEYIMMDLNNETWVLDRGAYVCSEMGIEISVVRNKLLTGLAGGEGMFQTKVSGSGKLVLQAPGPVEVIELNNEKLTVDGSFAVAREGQLNYSLKKATKGLFSSMTSGEGFVNVIEGSGKVLLAPVPNAHVSLVDYIGSIIPRPTA